MQPDLQNDLQPSNIRTKMLKILSKITVEPIMCFYVFAQMVSFIAVYNLTFQMACQVNLNLNETICEDLLAKNNSDYEILVQKEAAKILVWKRPLCTIGPMILILFLGSYSDRYKIRKPFLLLPLFGELMISSGLFLCTTFINTLPMESLAGYEVIFTALTGGLTTVKIAVYSYVSDITSQSSRTTRLGVIQILSSFMSPVAIALSGILFKTTGFYGVFTLRTFIFIVGICYGLLIIRETRVKEKSKNTCVDFFDPQNVKNTFSILNKKHGNRRLKILLLLITFIIIKGTNSGELDMLFLYTRVKFQFDDVTYSLYNMYDIIIRLIGSATAIYLFSQWLKLDDLVIAIITFVSKIIGSFLFAFCPSSSFLYVASVISLFCDYQTVPIRSLASKLVSENELGRLQSLFGICEVIAPSIFGPLYSAVYRYTVETIPGAYYLTGASALIPMIPAFIILYFIQRRQRISEDIKIKQDTFKYIVSAKQYL